MLYDFASPTGITAEQRDKQTVRNIERAVRKIPFNVATAVHEATHQLSFNSGLHTRFADNPVWLTEGLAMYFESADPGTGSKSIRIGRSNSWRRKGLKTYLRSMSAETVTSLTESDERFRNAETATDAYTEAWALTTYLMNRKQAEFIEFIKSIQAEPRLIWRKPAARIENFESTVGSP